MTAVPEGSESPDSGNPPPPEAQRLSLADPLDGRASEDRPEAWGEQRENASERLARYRAETPPHHGT